MSRLVMLWLIAMTASFNVSLSTTTTKRPYEGYSLLSMNLRTQEQINELRTLQRTKLSNDVSVWSEANRPGDNVTLSAPQRDYQYLWRFSRENQIKLNVVTKDLQSLIDNEVKSKNVRRTFNSQTAQKFDLFTYNSYSEITQHLNQLASNCPVCSIFNIGKSYEKRDMIGIKIGKSADPGVTKQSIWIDGGIHAREWISPSTVVYIIQQLVDGFLPLEMRYFEETQETARIKETLLKTFDWYILPVLNPDGYEYSRDGQRLWRKSREPIYGSNCIGTDLNRNWGFHWGEGDANLANPCSEIYAGERAFSAPETMNVRNFLNRTVQNPVIFLTVHSYGQLILIPWGYTDELAENYDEMFNLATIGKEAIESTHGKIYRAGSSPQLLYTAAGCSDDWALGTIPGLQYSYTFELRGSLHSHTGFILQEDQIKPTGEEIWAAVEAMTLHVSRS